MRRLRWLGLGSAALAASAITYAVLVRTQSGQVLDAELMSAILETVPGPVGAALATLARPLLFYVLAPVVTALALLAIVRGRWAAAVGATLVTAVPAPVSLYLREEVLTRPSLGVRGYDFNTFPSTHAAVAFGLLAALLLVWPRPVEGADISRAAFVAALVLLGNVTSYAHRPADVLGSVLLVSSATWLTVGLVGYRPPPAARNRGTVRPASRAHLQ